MFFAPSIEVDVDNYVVEQWPSLASFTEHLNSQQPALLHGFGFIGYEKKGQFSQFVGYHIVKINNILYGIGGNNLNDKIPNADTTLSFEKVVEFKASILQSSLFEANQFRISVNNYKNFEADLPIEAKVYHYTNEETLRLSKYGEGNIDLYCSYEVSTHSHHELKAKIFPSAFSVAKHLAMTKLLNERFENHKS